MALLLLLLVLLLAGCSRVETPSLCVTGTAEILVVPDLVEIELAVRTRDQDPVKAQTLNQASMKRLLALARGYEVDPNSLQTGTTKLEKVKTSEGLQYAMVRQAALTLRRPSMTDKLIADLVKSGANEIEGVSLRSTDLQKYRAQARVQAVQAARQKAEMIARTLGQTVGPAREVQEASTYEVWAAGSNHSSYALPGVFDESLDGATALGRIPVKATVAVRFDLR